jgi:hypothetical protein
LKIGHLDHHVADQVGCLIPSIGGIREMVMRTGNELDSIGKKALTTLPRGTAFSWTAEATAGQLSYSEQSGLKRQSDYGSAFFHNFSNCMKLPCGIFKSPKSIDNISISAKIGLICGLAYFRHTGQWWQIGSGLDLDKALGWIKEGGLLSP